ncbi:MAG: hypothetical protein ACPL7O_11425 [Armatimonadota bacterium]
MTATTTDRDTKRSEGKLKAMKMAAVKIPKGVLVCINSSGYVTNGADSSGLLFAGVSYEQVDNSGGAAGDKQIRVEKSGEHTFVYNGDASQAIVGRECYIVDNQTVDEDALEVINDIKCGVITEVVGTSQVRVRIDNYAR